MGKYHYVALVYVTRKGSFLPHDALIRNTGLKVQPNSATFEKTTPQKCQGSDSENDSRLGGPSEGRDKGVLLAGVTIHQGMVTLQVSALS